MNINEVGCMSLPGRLVKEEWEFLINEAGHKAYIEYDEQTEWYNLSYQHSAYLMTSYSSFEKARQALITHINNRREPNLLKGLTYDYD